MAFHETTYIKHQVRRGSRILKWGVNFCNNVIESRSILRDKKTKKEGGTEKGG